MTIKTTKIDGITFSFVNEEEFAYLYDEVFYLHEYGFTANTTSPFILDCGAHIGISTLYFKKLYPRAKVIAFEPNPDTFKLLELNIRQNNLRDVELVNAAVSNSIEEIDFYICQEAFDSWTWAWGSAGVKNEWYSSNNYKTIKVPTVKLSSYINQTVDLLKVDIEGMEEIVLKEIEGKLSHIKDIRMEFHGGTISNEFNSIENLVSIMNRNRFKLAIKQNGKIIRFDQIERKDTYSLIIYMNRQRSALWRQSVALPQMNRLRRASSRLLAMIPLRNYRNDYILHKHHRNMYMPHLHVI